MTTITITEYRYGIPDNGLYAQLSYWSKSGLRTRAGVDLYHDDSDGVSSIANGWTVLNIGFDAVLRSQKSFNVILGANTELRRLSYPSGYDLCYDWYYASCPSMDLGSLDVLSVFGFAYRFKGACSRVWYERSLRRAVQSLGKQFHTGILCTSLRILEDMMTYMWGGFSCWDS